MERSTKILIVDDDSNFVGTLKDALVDNSYSVITASDRIQAEDMVRSEEPDIIILGTIMPRGDAFLFHQWLRQSLGFGSLPIVVVNAPPEKQILKGWRLEEGLQCDAEDFLARPLKPEALVTRIQNLLDKKAVKRIRVLVVDDHV